MKGTALLLAGILVVVAGWFFLSPLFIDETVNEEFDFLAADGGVDLEKIMAMPPATRRAMMADIMDSAASAPDDVAAEAMPFNAPQVIAQGQFRDADSVHKGSGQASLYALADGRYAVRFEDFRTTNGPDLVVYLARHPAPTQASDVTEGGYLTLGKLKGNVGDQNYLLPPGTEVDEYNSVVIWCELFGVLFSPASLTKT